MLRLLIIVDEHASKPDAGGRYPACRKKARNFNAVLGDLSSEF
jgi:hypothetical protein